MTASIAPSRGIETFTLRPATLDDLPEIVALANACARETTGRDEYSLEEAQNEWSDPGINLPADTRVAVMQNGRIAGCVELWNTAPYIECWTWACVHPELRGRGIGTALMDWAEQRARRAIDLAPAHVLISITAAAISTDRPAIDLLSDRGFRVIRHKLTMTRDLEGPLPAPAWPAGIAVRTMKPGEERAVYAAADESFKDHWGYIERPFEQGFASWRQHMIADPDHDPSLWFLAIDGDEIAGVALCWGKTTEDPAMGWVSMLGVRRPWRRRGLAEALLYHSFGELRRRGCARFGLGVDASSLTGATRLYEKAGMRAIRTQLVFDKELRAGIDLTTQTIDQGA